MAEMHKVTVLMIAHRLETAVNYSDRILVMDKGTVAEFDHSYKLLVETEDSTAMPDDQTSPTKDTIFSTMVQSLTQ